MNSGNNSSKAALVASSDLSASGASSAGLSGLSGISGNVNVNLNLAASLNAQHSASGSPVGPLSPSSNYHQLSGSQPSLPTLTDLNEALVTSQSANSNNVNNYSDERSNTITASVTNIINSLLNHNVDAEPGSPFFLI